MSKKINERDREDLLITSSCHLSLTLKKFQRLKLWHEVSDTPLSEISASSLSWMSRNCFPKIFQDSEHIMYLNTSPHDPKSFLHILTCPNQVKNVREK
ncbi:hypothetical protein YC2023_117278 [Brassica napus]